MIDGVVEQDPKVNVDECRSSVFVQVEGLALGGNVKEEESMATDCGWWEKIIEKNFLMT